MQRKLPDHLRGLPEWALTQRIIGAFFETYNGLGFGFLESVYRNALAIELTTRGLQTEAEKSVRAIYKGKDVGSFRLDLLVESRVAVELKATAVLAPTDQRQLLNYLRVTSLDVGLLLHYGPEPKFHRIVSPRVLRTPRDREA